MQHTDPALPHVHHLAIAPRGGVPKPAVAEARFLADGIAGNAVAHPQIHGGPDRAVCLYALERIERLRAEGHPAFPGSLGENVTVAGLDWDAVAPGTRLRLGADVVVEVTQFAAPCRQIAGSFADANSLRIRADRHPGWSRVYARILSPGLVRTGDPVTVL
jgi:MOSC domain-containing protein YiiM